jgi:uncharacterized protein
MKSIEPKDLDAIPGKRLGENDTFCFRCHPGVTCFNLCCRNLNMFLYPYDVLRLKNHLGISSDALLDRYVDVVLREGNYFPEVLLKMTDNEERTCPFLSTDGCTVYVDRPDTCRTFPVEQGQLYNAHNGKTEVIHFFRPPDFCQGQHETKTWTPRTWATDQEAVEHNRMTARWAKLKHKFQDNPWGVEGPGGTKSKMAFMATYNIDRFREFVFHSSFLKRYRVKPERLRKIKRDDAKLLLFGFEWVDLFLFGTRSKNIRPR